MKPILLCQMMSVSLRQLHIVPASFEIGSGIQTQESASGATESLTCHRCQQKLLRNPLEKEGCVILTMTSHFNWPNQPWMYLEMDDTFRGMLRLTEILTPLGDVFFFYTDSEEIVCQRCFLNFLEAIENSCKNTSYEQFVKTIRTKHDGPREDSEDVIRSVQFHEVGYPTILSSQSGRGISSDNLGNSLEN